MKRKVQYSDIKSLEELKNHNPLYKKVLKIAQFESEVDLGVNPKNVDQADISNLSEKDFDYINEVSTLVSQRLNNRVWLTRTLQSIEDLFKPKPASYKGTQNNNELFKGGRGILEHHLKDQKKERV